MCGLTVNTKIAQLWEMGLCTHKLYIQQILVPLTVRNNVWALPGKTGVVSLSLQSNKTSYTPRHTITGKGVTYVKPFDSELPLRPIEIKFENNCCCIEVHNTSNSTCKVPFSLHMGVRLVFLISFAIVPKVLISSLVVYEYICCDFGECCKSVP